MQEKIFIAGHKGLAGSAFQRQLQARGYQNILTKDKTQLDLRDNACVNRYFEEYRPDWVIIAAAIVGGIKANMSYPVEFLLDNLKIQNNLIEASHRYSVKKLLFLASNCFYPKNAKIPIGEDALLTGPLETTNEAYALAKISGYKLCQAYNQQFGTNFITIVPTSLYGPNDNYHLEKAHVLPMLLRRFHESKLRNDKQVTVWGSGRPLREFLYSDDMADAGIFLLNHHDAYKLEGHINIGPGEEITILQLAEAIKEVSSLTAEIVFDQSKPDGIHRKALDSKKIQALGWRPKVQFLDGLRKTYEHFLRETTRR